MANDFGDFTNDFFNWFTDQCDIEMKKKKEVETATKDIADFAMTSYRNFIDVGFDPQQAFELLMFLLQLSIEAANNK